MLLELEFKESNQHIDFTYEEFLFISDSGGTYEGDYTITPKIDAQTMATKGLVMREDVTVKAIPFYNVSNTSGGSTVYIAKEI
jgi:hypothetical protein